MRGEIPSDVPSDVPTAADAIAGQSGLHVDMNAYVLTAPAACRCHSLPHPTSSETSRSSAMGKAWAPSVAPTGPQPYQSGELTRDGQYDHGGDRCRGAENHHGPAPPATARDNGIRGIPLGQEPVGPERGRCRRSVVTARIHALPTRDQVLRQQRHRRYHPIGPTADYPVARRSVSSSSRTSGRFRVPAPSGGARTCSFVDCGGAGGTCGGVCRTERLSNCPATAPRGSVRTAVCRPTVESTAAMAGGWTTALSPASRCGSG